MATDEQPGEAMRIDDLARVAGVASTTIRLYQTKGLLAGPRVVGRTGFYDHHHLARLRLIQRLQGEGFSLAGIGRVLETWEHGRDLADLVGVEAELDSLIGPRDSITLDPAELASRLPAAALEPESMRRAVALGLVELTDDGRIHIPDTRFLDTGAALARLGVPPDALLDAWTALSAHTDAIAADFIGLFERHLLPETDAEQLDQEQLGRLAATLGELRAQAAVVLGAAFDASIARLAASRLEQLGATGGSAATPADQR